MFARVLACDRVEGAAHAEPDVAPALAAGGPMVELAEPGPRCGLVGKLGFDAAPGEPVEHPELPLPQALVQHDLRSESGALDGDLGGPAGSLVGR